MDRKPLMNQIDISTIANLKNALYNCIVDALSTNTETRRVAEDKIAAMEIIEDFAIHLCDFSQNKDMDYAVRQLSSVLLKQYVDSHWNNTEEQHFLENFVVRNRIRKQLIEGLKEPTSKIRNAFACCIAYIGSLDYPDKWISFFDDLHQIALNTQEFAIHGIIRVYEDIIRDTDSQRLNQLAEPLLAEICYLLHKSRNEITVRMAAVHVLCLYVNICGPEENRLRHVLNEKLFALCEYFVDILQSPEKSVNIYGLKTNIIRFFTLLIQKFLKSFEPLLLMIVPHIWLMVNSYGVEYAQSIINDKNDVFDKEDEEGKVIGYTPMILAIFDFIHCLVDNRKLNFLVTPVLADIFYHIMIFMLVTKNMEESWVLDPCSFLEEDSSENFDTTIRITARDVLMMICLDFSLAEVIPHFSEAITRHTADLRFIPNEWKVHECLMFAMGSVNNIIIRASFTNVLQFSFCQLASTWQFALNNPNATLLFGRALWFSGKFSHILNNSLFNTYMKSTLTYLKDNDPVLRMFAIRAIIGHSEDFTNNPNKNDIVNHLPTITESLIDNISNVQTPSFLSVLSLRTLKIILFLNLTFAESMEPRITPLMINIFMKCNADPEIFTEIRYILKDYCLHSRVSMTVREKFIPILANILNVSDDKVPYGIQANSMDLLQNMIKCSKPPLSENLVLIGFPASIKCILHTDDQLIMSSGGECLRSFLLIGAEQICNYTDPEGTTGLEYILRAITQLLDPVHSEDACKRIGRLIITLINKAGPMLGSHMHYLLRAILSKMQRVEHMDVWQSLLIVFVFLFFTELEFVMSFLTSVPGPTGESALEFVVVEWLNRESFFLGSYDRTVSVVALAKILEYSVTSEDDRFTSIMVRDEYISKDLSSQKNSTWNQIPFLGKAFKIVCCEVAYYMQKNSPRHDDVVSSESDTDSETESHGGDYRYYDNDPDQQDVLYAQDPVFSIDVLAHLTDFIQKFKTIPRFNWYVSLLTHKEKSTLASLGIF